MVACSNKTCGFRLFFFAEYNQNEKDSEKELFQEIQEVKEGEDEEIYDGDEVNGVKITYKLTHFYQVHNHNLEKATSFFAEDIIREIDRVKGKMKTLVHIQDHINDHYGTQFSY